MIVSIEDDAFKRFLELPDKSMFKGLLICDMPLPCLTCETAEIRFLVAHHGTYGFNYDKTLCGADAG